MSPKRTRRRGVGAAAALAVLAIIAALVLRCGGGLGLGDGDGGEGDEPQTEAPVTEPDAAPAASSAPCVLRLDATGLSAAGEPVTLDEAVATCKAAGKANLHATGDANYGELQRVRRGLEAEDITVLSP